MVEQKVYSLTKISLTLIAKMMHNKVATFRQQILGNLLEVASKNPIICSTLLSTLCLKVLKTRTYFQLEKLLNQVLEIEKEKIPA